MRLIDAVRLINSLERWNTNDARDKAMYNFAMNRIIEQPIAYDVEAVVKELEEMKLIRVEQCHEDYEIEVMTASNFDDAIEIVRKGGVK